MGFKMKGFSGFTQKSGDYPGKDPITGGNNATYEKRSGEIMQAAKDEAKKKGYKPGTVNYSKLMEEARKKREALADSLRSATPQKRKKQVPLSGYEREKGTEITGGNRVEIINDLEDRIEYLESDLEQGKGDIAQLKILKARLAKMKARR
tara:strand:+ start:403 stop:852 length:450 start_codon:yes stop_codon:yes gene_type:complete